MIIRPIQPQDLPALLAIAKESGPGFTSLTDDPHFLQRKIAHSVDSFARAVSKRMDELYLFVLEDDDSGQVMGTTGIEASAGHERPLFHFRRSAVAGSGHERLTRCNHYSGCSELCSLYLRPAYRGPVYRRAHAGKLLSKVRFLFMAQHPQRFAQTVIAEMRGVADDRGQPPFWSWLRTQAGNLDFAKVTRLAATGNARLLDTLLPAQPLFTASMSAGARRAIGQVHQHTRPALKLLTEEGFRHAGFVDLFDAGPTVEAPLGRIASVQRSQTCQVQVVDDNMPAITRNQPGNRHRAILLANTGSRDFRAAVTEAAAWLPHCQMLTVPRSLADRLRLETGAPARFLPLVQAVGQVTPDTHSPTTEACYAH
ncbi:MAG: arginine N-succinyltransferase [Pseudomonadota bacterium]